MAREIQRSGEGAFIQAGVFNRQNTVSEICAMQDAFFFGTEPSDALYFWDLKHNSSS